MNPPSLTESHPFLDRSADIERHRHNLPHWRQGETWVFVTWRLADSVPRQKLAFFTAEKAAWLLAHPQPWSEAWDREYHELFSARIERWLDLGDGACVLRNAECARAVAAALMHFDGDRHRLGTFVVMPNHVHVLFRPIEPYTISKIVHSWKSFTARQINFILNKTGPVWQEDYWDRLIRGPEHLAACEGYIRRNPEKANLREGEFILRVGDER